MGGWGSGMTLARESWTVSADRGCCCYCFFSDEFRLRGTSRNHW